MMDLEEALAEITELRLELQHQRAADVAYQKLQLSRIIALSVQLGRVRKLALTSPTMIDPRELAKLVGES